MRGLRGALSALSVMAAREAASTCPDYDDAAMEIRCTWIRSTQHDQSMIEAQDIDRRRKYGSKVHKSKAHAMHSGKTIAP